MNNFVKLKSEKLQVIKSKCRPDSLVQGLSCLLHRNQRGNTKMALWERELTVAESLSCARDSARSCAWPPLWPLWQLVAPAVQSPSHVWLCNPTDCGPPGSSVHGILQARILELIAIFSSRGSSQSSDRTHDFSIGNQIYHPATWEVRCGSYYLQFCNWIQGHLVDRWPSQNSNHVLFIHLFKMTY